MTRYYQIPKESATGLKITEILNRQKHFSEKLKAFLEKYGAERYVAFDRYFAGIDGVRFKERPNQENWKKGPVDGYYQPKKNPKDKALRQEWDELGAMAVPRFDLDKAIGGSDFFKMAGFHFKLNGFYIAVIDDTGSYQIPSDCAEISNIEYATITQQKK